MSIHWGGRGPGHMSRWPRGVGASALGYARSLVEVDGGNVVIQFSGDSTGDAFNDFVRLFATWLGDEYPTHSVDYYPWGTTTYGSLESVSTGSGPNSIVIYNGCVPGAGTVYFRGSLMQAGVLDTNPDIIIWNHGHNEYSAGLITPHFGGAFHAAFDQFREALPDVPMAIILQNPRRDDDNMAAVVAAAAQAAAYYGDTIDVYSEFIARGKDSSLYADNIHPGVTGNPSGQAVILQKVIDSWRAGRGSPAVAANRMSFTGPNILVNGDFSAFAGATPDSWAAVASVTAEKELVIVDGASPYSVKLTGTTAGARLTQTISGASATALAGKQISLAARLYVPSGSATTVGRLSIRLTAGGNTDITSRAGHSIAGKWAWTMLAPITVPEGITSLQVSTYCNTAANADSAVYYDRVVLSETPYPRDMA